MKDLHLTKKIFFLTFFLLLLNYMPGQSLNHDSEIPATVKDKLKDSVKEILETFTSCITVIANKSEDIGVRNKYISLANSLFIPGSIMESISCRTKAKRREGIQEYLYRLRDLKYNFVKVYYPDVAYINWDEMIHVGKGVYRGVAYIYQVFEGKFSGSEWTASTYRDGTEKKITIEIKKVAGIRPGEVAWSVKLGDVLVEDVDCK